MAVLYLRGSRGARFSARSCKPHARRASNPMRACLACLLGLASALKVQEMVDASFREMAASGLQPVPQVNLRAEERCYVQCTRDGPLVTLWGSGGLWAWRCAPLPAQTKCWRLQTSSSEITLTCQFWSLCRDVAFPISNMRTCVYLPRDRQQISRFSARPPWIGCLQPFFAMLLVGCNSPAGVASARAVRARHRIRLPPSAVLSPN